MWYVLMIFNEFVYRNQNPMQTGLPKRPAMPYLAQHDELIRYIHDAWHKVNSINSKTFSLIFVLNYSNRVIANRFMIKFILLFVSFHSWRVTDIRTRPTWYSNILPTSTRTTIDKFPTVRFGKVVVSIVPF